MLNREQIGKTVGTQGNFGRGQGPPWETLMFVSAF